MISMHSLYHTCSPGESKEEGNGGADVQYEEILDFRAVGDRTGISTTPLTEPTLGGQIRDQIADTNFDYSESEDIEVKILCVHACYLMLIHCRKYSL